MADNENALPEGVTFEAPSAQPSQGQQSNAIPEGVTFEAPAGTQDQTQDQGKTQEPSMLDVANEAYASDPNASLLSKAGKALGRTAMIIPNAIHTATKGMNDADKLVYDTAGGGAQGAAAVEAHRFVLDPSEKAWKHVHELADTSRQKIEQARQSGKINNERADELLSSLSKYEKAGKALSVVPMLGPFALGEGEQAGKGDVLGTIGDVVLPAVLSELGLKAFGSKAKAAVQEAKTTTPAPATSGTVTRPTTVDIAGEKVPVSSPQLANQSKVSKLAGTVASEKAAQKMIDTKTAPAAARAVKATFRDAVSDHVSELQKARGETPTELPPLETVDEMAKHLEGEAVKTYKTLDKAAAADAGDAKASKFIEDVDNTEASAAQTASAKSGVEPEVPKGEFTKLQEKISDAKRTVKSKMASSADKEEALNTINTGQAEMKDFLAKHGDVVKPGELDAANSAYQTAQRYKYLAKNTRSAVVEGSPATGELKSSPTKVNKQVLETLPARFDNKFGEGAFEKVLGKKGLDNFSKVMKVLENPLKQGGGNLPPSLGGFNAFDLVKDSLKWPVQKVADNLLFNPDFGKRFLEIIKGTKGEAGLPGTVLEEDFNRVKPSYIKENGKPFHEQEYPKSFEMEVHHGNDIFTDEVKGMNRGHALSRAKGNWPHASNIKVLEETTPKQVTKNASGESAASQEAINRSASEKTHGVKRFRIDTRSGREIPIVGADAIDATAGPYDRIVKRGPDGTEEILDEGRKAIKEKPKANTDYAKKLYDSTKSALGGSEKPVATRASDFKTSGEYDVKVDGKPYKIYRDPENGWWYEANGEHFSKNVIGFNKQEALDGLVRKHKK